MKKIIIIETLLCFVLAVLLVECILCLKSGIELFEYYNNSEQTILPIEIELATKSIIRGLASLLACIADIIVMGMIAVRNFKVFQPLIDKYNARKQELAAARAAKADADKQKRIEELQAELDALNSDKN